MGVACKALSASLLSCQAPPPLPQALTSLEALYRVGARTKGAEVIRKLKIKIKIKIWNLRRSRCDTLGTKVWRL